MIFYKRDLRFDYTNDKEIKLLIPYVMIECTRQVYAYNSEELSVSISAMWNLVTQSKKPLAKRERNNIATLFTLYMNDGKEYSYEEDIPIGGFKSKREGKNYISVDMSDIVTLFVESTMAKLPKHLANLLNIQSYLDGGYVHLSHEELVYKLAEEKGYSEGEIDWDNPNWFKRHTHKELLAISQKIVAFSNIEDLLKTRSNADDEGFNRKYMAEDAFNSYMKEMEDEFKVIRKFNSGYGVRKNKVVFCRVEHEIVVRELYKRICELEQFANNNKGEEKVNETPQKSSGKTDSRERRNSRSLLQNLIAPNILPPQTSYDQWLVFKMVVDKLIMAK